MEFLWSDNCVPFANKGIFSLRNGRVRVSMQVGGGGIAFEKFREPVFLDTKQVKGWRQKSNNNNRANTAGGGARLIVIRRQRFRYILRTGHFSHKIILLWKHSGPHRG